jgi:hypothetical protein
MLSTNATDVWECASSVYVSESTGVPEEQDLCSTDEKHNYKLEVLAIVEGVHLTTIDEMYCTQAEAFNSYRGRVAKHSTIAAALTVESIAALLNQNKFYVDFRKDFEGEHTYPVILLRGDRSWWCAEGHCKTEHYTLDNWSEIMSDYGYLTADKLCYGVYPRKVDAEISGLLQGHGQYLPINDGCVLMLWSDPSLGGGGKERCSLSKVYSSVSAFEEDNPHAMNITCVPITYTVRQLRYMQMIKAKWCVG